MDVRTSIKHASMLLYGAYLWQPKIDSLQMFIAKNKVAFSFEFISRMSMSKSKHQLTKNKKAKDVTSMLSSAENNCASLMYSSNIREI